MIVGLLLQVLGVLLDWVSGPLPVADLSLELSETLGSTMGEKLGPFDQIIPLVPIAQCLVLIFTVALPAYAIYSVTFWVYKHLPVLGKG